MNVFLKLGSAFGREDFFTASLALMIERYEPLRRSFLAWLERHTGEDLQQYNWTIETQSSSSSIAGDAIIDMKLVNPKIQIWCEHKIGSSTGIRTGKDGKKYDQLQKYLDAAARVMTGTTKVGKKPAPWPTTVAPGNPRVLLFYITRDQKNLDRTQFEAQVASTGGHGLVWPDGGHLRWHHLWPSADNALQEIIEGPTNDFDRTLTRQFRSYWMSLPNMWSPDTFDSEWLELLHTDDKTPVPFHTLWEWVSDIALGQLKWKYKSHYKGIEMYYSTKHDRVDQVVVSAVTKPEEIRLDGEPPAPQVIQLMLRVKTRPANLISLRTQTMSYLGWRALVGVTLKDKGGCFVRVYVAVRHWNRLLNTEQRQRAVAASFVAGLKLFEAFTDIELEGVDSL